VSPTPASWTPSIATTSTDGTTEEIRQLTACGDGNMYAVGQFSSIKQGANSYTRNNVFSFSATSGAMTTFNPNVNGKVDTIALSPDCSTAYLGGSFSSVNGTSVQNIAAVNVATNTVVSSFGHSASAEVYTLLLTNNHLIAGGKGYLAGTTNKYMASLNPTTGTDDGYIHLGISGHYVFTEDNGTPSGSNPTNVYNLSLSPTGTKLLAMGDFTSVGGTARRQIFMLDLGATTTAVDNWYSREFNQNCNWNEAFWLQDASWSPDGSTIYTAATGYKPATDNNPTALGNDPNTGVTTGNMTTEPRGGLCDAAAAFASTVTAATPVPNHKWVQYTGCDSLYSTAVDPADGSVYVGGHHRWLDNPLQCDNNNNGTAVTDPGIGGLDPSTGHAYTTSSALQGKYIRSRGTGADDEVVTPQGLWIASDNGTASGSSQTCGGVTGHAGLCLLPH